MVFDALRVQASEVEALFRGVEAVCRDAGATVIQIAKSGDERARFWKGRKAAFAAMGRVSPNYYVQDGVVPNPRCPAAGSRDCSSTGCSSASARS